MRDRNAVLADVELVYDFLSAAPEPPERADLILALGNHDLRVPGYAAALYHAGAAPLVVCAGGLGKLTEGVFPEPEAVLFSRRCVELGVPAERILIEPRSTNTGENFRFARALLAERGLVPHSGILVTKPYMAKRALATGAAQWAELDWYVGTPALRMAENFPDGPTDTDIAVMVGDLQRLRVYAELGFQAPVAVPEPIWAAYKRLVLDGFDGHVIR